MESMHDCDVTTCCTNTAGSFYSSCREGFAGDHGRPCSGRIVFSL